MQSIFAVISIGRVLVKDGLVGVEQTQRDRLGAGALALIMSGEIMTSQLDVARLLKFDGPSAISGLANSLGLTYEAVRQIVEKMQSEDLVTPISRPERSSRGRPAQAWTLTIEGEHLFPKHYDELTDTLLTVLGRGTHNGKAELLAEVASRKTEALAIKNASSSREERLEVIRRVYKEDDAFISIESTDEGIEIVEHNCPYLRVAIAHPGLCSVTTNVMSQILGQKVVRIETFQRGAGRCVFRVLDEEAPGEFVFEV